MTVAVLIPVLNEARSLPRCLRAVLAQSLPPNEILVIDGGSTDRTRELASEFPGVTVVDNPLRLQAAGLNVGLRTATSDVIVRVDGHSFVDGSYVERCLRALARDEVAMAGGMMRPVGQGWMQRGIASALASGFGAGPARFHTGGSAGWVDTVYLGAYRRIDAIEVGGYDEHWVANEDAEFAIRIRAKGGVWFDPMISAEYEPRSGLPQLGRQFFRYGRGRAATVRRHPRSLALRQLAAPALVIGLLSPARRPVSYVYLAGIAGLAAAEFRKQQNNVSAFALALPVMHLSWGCGFLLGLARPSRPVRESPF